MAGKREKITGREAPATDAHTAFRTTILLLAQNELGTVTSAELREELTELVPLMQADLAPKPEADTTPHY